MRVGKSGNRTNLAGARDAANRRAEDSGLAFEATSANSRRRRRSTGSIGTGRASGIKSARTTCSSMTTTVLSRPSSGSTKEFPDDVGEPGHFLCWSLALHRVGNEIGAAQEAPPDDVQQPVSRAALARLANRRNWISGTGRATLRRPTLSTSTSRISQLWTEAEREWAEGPLLQPGIPVGPRALHRNQPGRYRHHETRPRERSRLVEEMHKLER